MSTLGLFLFCSSLALTVGVFPSNGRGTDTGFRSLTIQFDEMTNWNTSGTATQKVYEFHYELKDKPEYFTSSSVTRFLNSPEVTIENLFINQVIKLRVGLKTTQGALKDEDYSPWYEYAVRNATEAGPVIVPGEVLNLKVKKNADNQSIHSAIITFNDPTNVQAAQNANDKSVQYIVEYCHYNHIVKLQSGCKTLTQFLRDTTTINQTTLQQPQFYTSDIHPTKHRELIFKVTGVSLNGTRGRTAQLITTLDPVKQPDAPYELNSTDIHADRLTMTMKAKYEGEAYLLYTRYNIKGNSTTVTKLCGLYTTQPECEVTSLTANTEYEFQTALWYLTFQSGWSAKYTVKTSNSTSNKAGPTGSSSNMLTSSSIISTVIAMVITFVLFGKQ